MKWAAPSIKLVACGYEQDSDWNYTKMERTAPNVNISINILEHEKNKTVSVPYIDCVATGNAKGELLLSIINRHPKKDISVELQTYSTDIQSDKYDAFEIYHDCITTANTEKEPDNITIKKVANVTFLDGKPLMNLKKHSINFFKFSICR